MKKLLLILNFLLIAKILFAQSGTVTGTLADADGYALPGVTIMIKGTTIGTITDLDGKYSIDCNLGETLVISFIGMETKEIIVTYDMFQSINSNPIKRYETFRNQPVQTLQNKAYSELLRKNKIDPGGYIDMYSAPYSWTYADRKHKGNYFYGYQFIDIQESDSIFVFVEMPQANQWEIEVSSTTAFKELLNLPKLQSVYAQGRPYLGENTWFGAENNEQFAFGPKIQNLVFDGSKYDFDSNGKLIPIDAFNLISAKAYNPYNLIQKSVNLINSVNLSTIIKETNFNFSYLSRKEVGFFKTNDALTNNLNFNVKRNEDYSNFNFGLDYNHAKNEFVNSNALWTKTFAAIMLTPPTFDNSQGSVLFNGNQRSSAPEFNNNPYFLLAAKDNYFDNTYFKTNLEYNYTEFYLNMGIAAKYDRNNSIENFNIPQNTIGFENNYIQNEDIISEELYFKLILNSDERNDFTFASMPVFTIENIEFFRKINDSNNFAFEKNRRTFNWTQNMNFKPNFLPAMFLNFKNTTYINSHQQNWLLPTFAISYDFAERKYWDNINTLKLYGNFTSAVNEMPLYFSDKSYTTLRILPSQMNTFIENNELFYNENLALETRKTFNLGINSYFFNNKITLDLDYQNTISENSIFPILTANSFELQNIASIRNQSLEFNIEYVYQFYYNYQFGWKTSLSFSMQRPVTKEIYGNNTQIPIAGFQSVSKNLIANEPVGVLVGSTYQRNENGQMIIGSDGFPLEDDKMKIIGNPNPDFKLFFENSFNILRIITINMILEYQKGGDIWNGTKNTLDYFGLSESSATDRNITNYIFDGVNELGQINSIPVDFANPENGLEGNRWFQFGENGVAEAAIEDGSYFRIRDISVQAVAFKNNDGFVRNITVKFYVQNLWTSSKYSGSSPNSYFNNYVQGRGLDYFNIPETREIGLSIKIKI